MRRIVIGSSSFAAKPQAGLGIEGLDDVELAEMADTAAEADREAEVLAEDAQRAIDVTDVMEDTAAVLDARPADAGELTETEQHLIAVAGNATVSGTDTEPTAVIPALEGDDAKDPKSFAQRIMARARAILAEIIKLRDRIIKALTDFFYNFMGEVPSIRRNLEAVKKARAAAKGGELKGYDTFEVSSEALYVEGKPVDSGASLIKRGRDVVAASDFVFGKVAGVVEKRGKAVAESLNGIGKSDNGPRDKAAALVTRMKQNDCKLPDVPQQARTNTPRFADSELFLGQGLLGGKSLAQRRTKGSDGDNLLAQMSSVRNEMICLVPTDTSAQSFSPIKFHVMSDSEIGQALDLADSLLKAVEDWRRGAGFDKMKNISEEVKKASAAGTEAIKNVPDADLSVLKGMMNFNIAFGNWMKNPFQDMVRYNVSVAKLLIQMANRSVKQYKK